MQRLTCDAVPRTGWLPAQGRRQTHSRTALPPRAAAGAEVTWSVATVTENRPACADGSLRTLTLSVRDEWKEVQLRRGTSPRHERPRWADAHTRPGQFVALRPCSDDDSSDPSVVAGETSLRKVALRSHAVLLPLSSSPYATHRDSAFLDAAIVDVLVCPGQTLRDGTKLASLAPGSLLSVSPPTGAGFCSLFRQGIDLSAVLEQGRPLLVLGGQVEGAGAVRACIEWQPVAAHAGIHPVCVFLSCSTGAGAPYVSEWDKWREAGVVVRPCFESDWQDAPHTLMDAASALEEGLLHDGARGIEDMMGAPLGEVAVLIAGGLPSDVRARVIRQLQAAGANNELFLINEPF